MSEIEIYGALTEIFHDVFMRDDFQLTSGFSAKDLAGWDLFKMIEIIMATEEHFGFKMSSKDADALQCVGDLVKVIEANRH